MSAPPELLEAVRALLEAAPTTPPEALIAHADSLRGRVEEALFGADDPEAVGLLNDAVVSVSLYARAAAAADTEAAGDHLEQARLFLAAAAS